MKNYIGVILKACLVIVLVFCIIKLNKMMSNTTNEVYIPDYEAGLPSNSYYTEESFDYETNYREDLMDKFVEYITNSDFESAYELLSDDNKKNKYKSASELRKYIEGTGILNENSEDIYYGESNLSVEEDKFPTFSYVITSKSNNSVKIVLAVCVAGPYDMKIKI